ncbi:hypothetical protein TNIN_129711 [Trichonephila inaurata madagascariensis]|uniref:Uncharacterized protein n=1 Tax=Trichonephila inaurata madagascariensis TaxID=2747483 RepID=A0A8X6M8Q2_9ARAC|nr:hypothetical protein TNIN_129711 [Trichonephila inaurata madagascariensis]
MISVKNHPDVLLVRKPGAPWQDVSIRGRRLTSLLHLQTLAEHNGTACTPWVTLLGDYSPDVHRPFPEASFPRSECGIGNLSEEPVVDHEAVSPVHFRLLRHVLGPKKNMISFFLR